MAYADLAGLPYLYGLHSAFLPPLIGALFGRSFHLSTGPVAMTSILTASALSSFAPQGSPEYTVYALLLAFLIGILRLIIGLLRLSRVAHWISYPVVFGFTQAAALVIGISQLEKGISLDITARHHFLGSLTTVAELISRLPDAHIPSILMGLFALILILMIHRFSRLPGILVAMLITIPVSYFIGFEQNWGGRVIGAISRGIPSWTCPIPLLPVGSFLVLILKMLPYAIAITAIGFLEVFSVTKAVSVKSGQMMDYNREMIGQGAASLAAAFQGGCPVSGSLSRTALTYSSGGITGFSQVCCSLVILGVLLFFTPLLYHLPATVLSVSVMVAVSNLLRPREFLRMLHLSRREFSIALITFIFSLLSAPNIILGMLIGMGITGFLFLLTRDRGGFTEPRQEGNLLILRIRRSLLFNRVADLETRIAECLENSQEIRFLEIRSRSLKKVDISGLEGFKSLARRFVERKGAVVFIGMTGAMENYLRGLGEKSMLFYPREEDFLYYLSRCQ